MKKIEQQYEYIQAEFTKQALGWKQSLPEMLVDLSKRLPLDSDDIALDVAAGSGLVSLALAPYITQVVALDLTDAMIAQGRLLAQEHQQSNIEFVRGFAEKLPFTDNHFDLVITRYSFHHMLAPESALSEMYRVCKPSGRVVVMDLISPEDPTTADYYNHLEQLRDRTHTKALTLAQLKTLFEEASLKIEESWTQCNEMDLQHWLNFSSTPPKERLEIEASFDKELATGKSPTGFAPFLKDGCVKFNHHNGVIVGIKPV